MKMLRGLILKTTFALAALTATVFGTSFVEPAHAFGVFRGCDDPRIIRYIQNQTWVLDQNVLKRGLTIRQIFNIHETDGHYTPVTDVQLIPRLFCQGSAAMNDGQTRAIYYMVEQGQGFAGVGDYVSFCISGLDPWRIYGADCRSVR